jgi:hypothetical protein
MIKMDPIPFDREEKKLADAVVQAKIDKQNREQMQSHLEEKWRPRLLSQPLPPLPPPGYSAVKNVPLANPGSLPTRPATVHG